MLAAAEKHGFSFEDEHFLSSMQTRTPLCDHFYPQTGSNSSKTGWQTRIIPSQWLTDGCRLVCILLSGKSTDTDWKGGNRGAKYSQRHYPFTSFKGKKLPNIVQYNSGLVLKSKQMFLMQGTQKLPIFTFTCFLLPLLLLLLCLCV